MVYQVYHLHYNPGTDRIAMRTSSGVRYIFGDHPSTSLRTSLGSTSVTADGSGNYITRQLYTAWGEARYSSGSLPTRYTYTGQYSNMTDFGLLFYNARWYDPDLGRWAQADTIVPDPGKPADYDRYGYVKNNSLKYNDPSGHCSGDPENPDNPDLACWQMIDKIQSTYNNVHILNQDIWLLNELMAVWDALLGHVFIDEILSATSINFRREAFFDHEGDGIGGKTVGINGTYDVTIYDSAYIILPDVSGRGAPSNINFTGTVIHELAHVSIQQNPFIIESYSWRSNWVNHPESMLPDTYGDAYDRRYCENRCDEEMIAMAASTWQLDPASFYGSILFMSYTDWRKSWIELFYHPNPLARYDYGPSTIAAP